MSDNRCHVCGDQLIEDVAGSGLFRHKTKSTCPFQPGEDLNLSVCNRVLIAFSYPSKECRQLMRESGINPLAEPDASNLQKLSDLILDTPYGIIQDWRGDPTDGFLTPLIRIAAGFDVQIKAEYHDEDLDAVTLIVLAGRQLRRIQGRTGPAEVALSSLYELAKRVEKASFGRPFVD